MKIGDYVRDKDYGFIKVKSFYYNEDLIHILDENNNEYDFSKELVDNFKSSSNILDLIEPQDLMYIDIDNGYAGGIIVPRVAETINELKGYIDSFKNKETTLVGVVTHEQLYNCVYKVVE